MYPIPSNNSSALPPSSVSSSSTLQNTVTNEGTVVAVVNNNPSFSSSSSSSPPPPLEGFMEILLYQPLTETKERMVRTWYSNIALFHHQPIYTLMICGTFLACLGTFTANFVYWWTFDVWITGQGNTEGGGSLYALQTCLQREGGRAITNSAGFCITTRITDVAYQLDYFRISGIVSSTLLITGLVIGYGALRHTIYLRSESMKNDGNGTTTDSSGSSNANRTVTDTVMKTTKNNVRCESSLCGRKGKVNDTANPTTLDDNGSNDGDNYIRHQTTIRSSTVSPSFSTILTKPSVFPASAKALRYTKYVRLLFCIVRSPVTGIGLHVFMFLSILLAQISYVGIINYHFYTLDEFRKTITILTTNVPNRYGYSTGVWLTGIAWILQAVSGGLAIYVYCKVKDKEKSSASCCSGSTATVETRKGTDSPSSSNRIRNGTVTMTMNPLVVSTVPVLDSGGNNHHYHHHPNNNNDNAVLTIHHRHVPHNPYPYSSSSSSTVAHTVTNPTTMTTNGSSTSNSNGKGNDTSATAKNIHNPYYYSNGRLRANSKTMNPFSVRTVDPHTLAMVETMVEDTGMGATIHHYYPSSRSIMSTTMNPSLSPNERYDHQKNSNYCTSNGSLSRSVITFGMNRHVIAPPTTHRGKSNASGSSRSGSGKSEVGSIVNDDTVTVNTNEPTLESLVTLDDTNQDGTDQGIIPTTTATTTTTGTRNVDSPTPTVSSTVPLTNSSVSYSTNKTSSIPSAPEIPTPYVDAINAIP